MLRAHPLSLFLLVQGATRVAARDHVTDALDTTFDLGSPAGQIFNVSRVHDRRQAPFCINPSQFVCPNQKFCCDPGQTCQPNNPKGAATNGYCCTNNLLQCNGLACCDPATQFCCGTNCWLAVLGFLFKSHIAHALEGLLAAGFGWTCYRMIFKAPRGLGQTQIALFVTSSEDPADVHEEDKDKPVVWQVFDIGGAKREFAVEIPAVPGTGAVKLGFATIDDGGSDVKVVQCRTAEKAPARLLDGHAWEHEGEPEPEEQAKKDPKAPGPKPTATNAGDLGVRIALGTYDDEKMQLQPLLLVERLSGGAVYEAPEKFYLHAFRSNNYSAGQYGKTLFKDVIGDRLTPPKGIKLWELSPLTSWYIKSDKDGKLTLKIGRNSRKDVKAYRHECKIGKDATVKASKV
ncbi:hypothetical protein LshimejAT787_0705450 [Lyophyllum shimeji]|uniref:SMB domain-containing protein n=1 Tax=Lyophyllum shimeji TaxID=47721 RepID=A0A9P3PP37_LYOSH|nr:hypothetical protein LshimejAT787_0705450 [Lyophyllum shimeji]